MPTHNTYRNILATLLLMLTATITAKAEATGGDLTAITGDYYWSVPNPTDYGSSDILYNTYFNDSDAGSDPVYHVCLAGNKRPITSNSSSMGAHTMTDGTTLAYSIKLKRTEGIGFRVSGPARVRVYMWGGRQVYMDKLATFDGKEEDNNHVIYDTSGNHKSDNEVAPTNASEFNSRAGNNDAQTLVFDIAEAGTYWLTAAGDAPLGGFEVTQWLPISANTDWSPAAGTELADGTMLNNSTLKYLGAEQTLADAALPLVFDPETTSRWLGFKLDKYTGNAAFVKVSSTGNTEGSEVKLCRGDRNHEGFYGPMDHQSVSAVDGVTTYTYFVQNFDNAYFWVSGNGDLTRLQVIYNAQPVTADIFWRPQLDLPTGSLQGLISENMYLLGSMGDANKAATATQPNENFGVYGTARNKYRTTEIDNNTAIGFFLPTGKTYNIKVYFRSAKSGSGVKIVKFPTNDSENVAGTIADIKNITSGNAYWLAQMNGGYNRSKVINYTVSPGYAGWYWVTAINSDIVNIGGIDIDISPREDDLSGVSLKDTGDNELVTVTTNISWFADTDGVPSSAGYLTVDNIGKVQYFYGNPGTATNTHTVNVNGTTHNTLEWTQYNAQGFKLQGGNKWDLEIYYTGMLHAGLQVIRSERFVCSDANRDSRGYDIMATDLGSGYANTKVMKVSIDLTNMPKTQTETFWVNPLTGMTPGDNRNNMPGNPVYYAGFKITKGDPFVQIKGEEDSDPVELAESRLGQNGFFYINSATSRDDKVFPLQPRDGYQNTDYDSGSNQNILKIHDDDITDYDSSSIYTDVMVVMMGTKNVPIYRNAIGNNAFINGGVKWENYSMTDETKVIDGVYTYFEGDNLASASGSTPEVNANPYTEANGGIGGPNTEDGGLFLQPVSGDFFRFEPYYDGVVTLWVRQNGTTDGNTHKTGTMTRRPSYIVDENGYVMRQSTVKPSYDYSVNNHYCINGTWADFSSKNIFDIEFQEAWEQGMDRWDGVDALGSGRWSGKATTAGAASGALPETNKCTFRFYKMWYDGSESDYDYNNTGKVTLIDIDFDESQLETAEGTAGESYGFTSGTVYADESANTKSGGVIETEVMGAQADGKTVVVSRNQPMGLIAYESDALRDYETAWSATNGSTGATFAKYGYEVPTHTSIRYTFPVRAGKTYYLGGRGTKNAFAAVRFEAMKCNYNPATYVQATNHNVTINPYPATDATKSPGKYTLTASQVPSGFTTYDKSTVVDTYVTMPTYMLDASTGYMYQWDHDDQEWDDLSGYSAIPDDRTVNFTLKRTFRTGNWYPIVLPFSVSETKMREIFGDDVKVLYLDPYNNSMSHGARSYISAIRPAVRDGENTLHFTRHYYQMLYANTPAFICPSQFADNITLTDGAATEITFYHVHIDKTTNTTGGQPGYDIGGGYRVVGSYDVSNVTNRETYYLSNVDGRAVMYHKRSGLNMNMGATRVWIESTSGSAPHSAPALNSIGFRAYDDTVLDDNSQAGIDDVVMDDVTVQMYNDDNVYDLMGRIVGRGDTRSLSKGVYIHNGRKVYIR